MVNEKIDTRYIQTLIASRIGNYTPDFSSQSSVASITKTGTTATLTLTTPEDLEPFITASQHFQIIGARQVGNIQAIAYEINGNSNVAIDLSNSSLLIQKNDIITIAGCSNAELNGEHEVTELLTSGGFGIFVKGITKDTITTNGTVMEQLEPYNLYGFNIYTKLTKIDNSTYTFEVNELLSDVADGEIILNKPSCHVFASSSFERAVIHFLNGAGSGSSKALYVVMGEGSYKTPEGLPTSDSKYSRNKDTNRSSVATYNLSIVFMSRVVREYLAVETDNKARIEYQSALNKCLISDGYTLESAGTNKGYYDEDGTYYTYDYNYSIAFEFQEGDFVYGGSTRPLKQIVGNIYKDIYDSDHKAIHMEVSV